MFCGTLKEVCQKSKEYDENNYAYSIKINGLISPEEDIENGKSSFSVFSKTVIPFTDNEQFGVYCKFNAIIRKKGESVEYILIRIKDTTKKQFTKKPMYYTDLPEHDCVLFEWNGDTFYDCDRTYFHFGDDKDNVTGSNDFMHYKCKLNQIYIECKMNGVEKFEN